MILENNLEKVRAIDMLFIHMAYAFEIFSRNYHKWFWKLCHTAKPGLEHISTIFACLALHSIVIRIKKVKVFGAIWQRSIGSRIGGKVYPRYLKNCWGVHFMHGRHKWQYTRDHNSWLLVMDQNLTDDYFSGSGINVDISLRNTKNGGENPYKCQLCRSGHH